MNIQWIQHVPFEGLGSISAWADNNGHTLTRTRLFAGEKFSPDGDALIVMGGPMGVYDEQEHPWLRTEKVLIRKAIDDGRKVLGICLGAQLIAHVLGAAVFPGKEKEIGWFPVRVPPTGRKYLPSTVSESFAAFHWHGDTFALPDGAIHLFESDACANQGFLFKRHVLALQFHLETTAVSASALVKNCAEELVDAPFIQSQEGILTPPAPFANINQHMTQLLDWWSGL